MYRSTLLSFGLTAILALCIAGCEPAQNQPTATSEAAQTSDGLLVTKVIFVDQAECCDCTQGRIDGTWEALQTAIDGVELEVERLHRDTQESEVLPYQEMQPVMVVPAVYFLDSEGNLIHQLQGEVTVEQIQGVLGV